MTKSLFIAVLFVLMAAVRPPEKTPFSFPALRGFPPLPENAFNTTVEGAQLGRHLFYDPVLSKDSSVSCASCHRQEKAFSSSKSDPETASLLRLQSREVPPLFNLAWHKTFFWDGRAHSLEEQALFPLRRSHELNLSWTIAAARLSKQVKYRSMFAAAYPGLAIDSLTITGALAQFERTIISANSRYDKALRGEEKFTQDELEGFELVNDMTKGNCLHCHPTDGNALTTTMELSDNALDEATADAGIMKPTGSSAGPRKFKIPALRNLAFTGPYMHDGRFKTLEEVLDFYSEGLKRNPAADSRMEFIHQGGSRLTKEEKRKIIAFLGTLNDYALLTDTSYADPFLRQ